VSLLAGGFWLLVALVAYVYGGYPLLLRALGVIRRPPGRIRNGAMVPDWPVSLIIAAHNEENQIAGKLANSLALDYPGRQIEIVVVSDGSTDRTADVVRGCRSERVHLVNLVANVGKAAAQNEAAKQATGEILVFSDADVSLGRDALRMLVRHFGSEDVGCVTSRVEYVNPGETNVTRGEGLYWRYEVNLREQESRVGNLTSGSGAAIAVRRRLFEPLDPAVSEDFFLPMRVALRGYRTVFEPDAVARTPLQQDRPGSMFETRMRTIMLDARSVWLCRAILNPIRYPLYALGVISHKILRWLVPCFLLALLAVNVALVGDRLYDVTLGLQAAFYLVACAGYAWERTGRAPSWFVLPFVFCLVNAAALIAVVRLLTARTSGTWTPVR
jgi:hypothetical protein